jgi:hypothetical protein
MRWTNSKRCKEKDLKRDGDREVGRCRWRDKWKEIEVERKIKKDRKNKK